MFNDCDSGAIGNFKLDGDVTHRRNDLVVIGRCNNALFLKIFKKYILRQGEEKNLLY